MAETMKCYFEPCSDPIKNNKDLYSLIKFYKNNRCHDKTEGMFAQFKLSITFIEIKNHKMPTESSVTKL